MAKKHSTFFRFTSARPSILEPDSRQRQIEARPGQTVTLECEASGVPPPMIIWRFNWGCLRDPTRMRSEPLTSRLGCRGSRGRLVIESFREGDDGIYNCEALSGKDRAMSQDIYVVMAV
ncbi:unnamed protein product [Protopolystoma xenopodis]|uniref:Ig-like domain-containing protein n=1 Tax=Protopolystoma xenopodis TaxID=117903 RepID=A0A448XR99_9PLAT|nr:unnamed protein product [Protopolystoma xenopodis]